MINRQPYNLYQSPLYRLGRKKDLAKVLGVSLAALNKLKGNNGYYSKVNEKKRELQPTYGLKRKVHNRIKDILSRIEYPEYVKSGVKGKSIVNNAEVHKEAKYVLKLDIEKFYPSCKQKYVYRFFYHVLEMKKDIAYLLSKVVTYNDFIPTGSPLSQTMAFYSNRGVFNEINCMCIQEGIKFTLYVDDLTFSSKNKIPKNFAGRIAKILKKDSSKAKRGKI